MVSFSFLLATNGTPDVIKTTASSPQTSSTIKSSFVSGKFIIVPIPTQFLGPLYAQPKEQCLQFLLNSLVAFS